MIELISFQTLWPHLLGKGEQTQTCCHSQLSFYDTEMVGVYICRGFKLWAYFSGHMLTVDYKKCSNLAYYFNFQLTYTSIPRILCFNILQSISNSSRY